MSEMTALRGLPEPSTSLRADARRSSFMFSMACVLAFIAFAGFSPSFFLRSQFSRPPLPSFLVVMHGVAMSAWMLLFVAQAALVRMGQARWHRALGVAGAGLALVIVLLTLVAQMGQTHRVVAAGDLERQPFFVNSLSIGATITTLIFGGLVAAAVLLRRSPQSHRRLMLLATLTLTSAAILRLVGMLSLPPIATSIAMDILLLVIVLNDLRALHRLHRATLWGGLPIVAFQVLTFTPLYTTGAASAFSRWLAAFGI